MCRPPFILLPLTPDVVTNDLPSPFCIPPISPSSSSLRSTTMIIPPIEPHLARDAIVTVVCSIDSVRQNTLSLLKPSLPSPRSYHREITSEYLHPLQRRHANLILLRARAAADRSRTTFRTRIPSTASTAVTARTETDPYCKPFVLMSVSFAFPPLPPPGDAAAEIIHPPALRSLCHRRSPTSFRNRNVRGSRS